MASASVACPACRLARAASARASAGSSGDRSCAAGPPCTALASRVQWSRNRGGTGASAGTAFLGPAFFGSARLGFGAGGALRAGWTLLPRTLDAARTRTRRTAAGRVLGSARSRISRRTRATRDALTGRSDGARSRLGTSQMTCSTDGARTTPDVAARLAGRRGVYACPGSAGLPGLAVAERESQRHPAVRAQQRQAGQQGQSHHAERQPRVVEQPLDSHGDDEPAEIAGHPEKRSTGGTGVARPALDDLEEQWQGGQQGDSQDGDDDDRDAHARPHPEGEQSHRSGDDGAAEEPPRGVPPDDHRRQQGRPDDPDKHQLEEQDAGRGRT